MVFDPSCALFSYHKFATYPFVINKQCVQISQKNLFKANFSEELTTSLGLQLIPGFVAWESAKSNRKTQFQCVYRV